MKGPLLMNAVQAAGAGRTTSWFVVVDHREGVPAADVYAFAPNPYERIFALVRFILTMGNLIDVTPIFCTSLGRPEGVVDVAEMQKRKVPVGLASTFLNIVIVIVWGKNLGGIFRK